MNHFNIENLMTQARERTGLSNFGSEISMDGLEQLVEGMNKSQNLKADRIAKLSDDIVRMLSNILWRQRDFDNHPEIAEQALLPPLTIVSLPRTGTTKLQRILGATGAFQETLYWYCYMPSSMSACENHGADRRIRSTQDYCAWRLEVDPDIQQTHTLDTFIADEDMFLVESCFRSPGLAFLHQSAEYGGWLAQQDLSESYDFLASQLRYLQWQFYRDDPKPWLLKSPAHLANEDQLRRIYDGNNKIVCPHREPAQIFPSICRLFESWIELYYELPMPKEQFGQIIAGAFSQSMAGHMAWRDRNPEVEILDMSFKEICDDSVASVEKIFEFAGMPFSEQNAASVRAWDADNPRHKEGKAKLTLEEYGLSEAMINAMFAEYRERFAAYL